MKKIFLYLFSIIFLFSTQLNAIEKKKLTDTEWNEKINTLKWYNEDGKSNSINLSKILENIDIDMIFSSPFLDTSLVIS